jgi:hypothetical protein
MGLVRFLAVGSLLFLMACAQIWGMQDLTLAPEDGSAAGPDATRPDDDAGDAGAGDDVVDDMAEEGHIVDAARPGDAVASGIDGGDACVSDPRWCGTHCGPTRDNCGGAISCLTCTPKDAGCSMGACDSGAQCCTGYCGSAGTCVSTCSVSTASCTILNPACCYGLTCKTGFPPVIQTCQ